MKRNRMTAIVFYIIAVVFYIVALINIFDDQAMRSTGLTWLCLGSMWLCLGSVYLHKSQSHDDSDSDNQ